MTRRHFITSPGERLLLSDDALAAAARVVEFAELTGLELEHVVSDPVVTTPMPLYVRGGRFSQVNPEVLWHPLFWLPEDVGLRLQVMDADGSTRIETDAEWLARVAIEVQHAELYQPEHGWEDVLALAGLDIDDPSDLARLAAWQAGGEDATLDSIDLSPRFALSREEAFHLAASTLETALPAQWSLTASSILEAVEASEEPAALIELAELMLADESTGAAKQLEDPLLTHDDAIAVLTAVARAHEVPLAIISTASGD